MSRPACVSFSSISSDNPVNVFSFAPQTPVIALVGNDACWSQISREQVPILGSNVACGLAFSGAFSSTNVGLGL